ncbi:hypothetical protein SAMN05444266_104323 [Chitinophaga jiangningensis]|uniref:Uncharacterized protein n=1 Tax=Chitinophaga jiangningensis TaxID=1419482 RepID=A0A1M7CH15_9BACT|nr:hypothetical protein SAMN05444266_104323 [Chitinophaga jiangningensis]
MVRTWQENITLNNDSNAFEALYPSPDLPDSLQKIPGQQQ